MSQRSNISASTVLTVSKTRTKPNATRILSTFASILGPALPSTASMILHSTRQPLFPLRKTTLLSLQHQRTSLQLSTLVATVVNNFRMSRRQTGMNGLDISLIRINLASATSQRSSSAQIIFASTLNTAMQEQVGNGQTCWKTLA